MFVTWIFIFVAEGEVPYQTPPGMEATDWGPHYLLLIRLLTKANYAPSVVA